MTLRFRFPLQLWLWFRLVGVQKSETGVLFRELFSDGGSYGGGFLRPVAVEVNGLEPLQHRGRSGKLGLWVLGAVPRLPMGSLSPQTRGDKNGTDHQVEEEEEDSGCEPAVHGSPDRRYRHGFFKHGSSPPQKKKEEKRKESGFAEM